jgi:hypothetical protein
MFPEEGYLDHDVQILSSEKFVSLGSEGNLKLLEFLLESFRDRELTVIVGLGNFSKLWESWAKQVQVSTVEEFQGNKPQSHLEQSTSFSNIDLFSFTRLLVDFPNFRMRFYDSHSGDSVAQFCHELDLGLSLKSIRVNEGFSGGEAAYCNLINQRVYRHLRRVSPYMYSNIPEFYIKRKLLDLHRNARPAYEMARKYQQSISSQTPENLDNYLSELDGSLIHIQENLSNTLSLNSDAGFLEPRAREFLEGILKDWTKVYTRQSLLTTAKRVVSTSRLPIDSTLESVVRACSEFIFGSYLDITQI